MENQTNIISEFNEMIAREEKRLKEKNIYKRLAAVNDLYNEWLEKGLIKKRGYTLRTIDDWHLLRVRINGY
jgi:hypothetical protein